MQFIVNNPYRILGLPVTATDRQIAKRASDLSIYAEMGKIKTYEYDFGNLAHLDRSPNAIEDATRQLEQPKDKLLHSIFWLNYDNKENYLQQLNDDNFAAALENIPNSTVQNLQNKAVLTLFSNDRKGNIKQGINYFDRFLNHSNINKFISDIVGERSAKNFELYDLFIDQILPSLRKNSDTKELLSIFEGTSKAEYVKAKIVKPIVNKIESEIETAKNKTNSDPTNAYKFGKELIDNTSGKLTDLISILSESDLLYTSISNKLAEQILDCSIAYFNKNYENSKENIGNKALELAELSKQIAKSSIIIERIEKNVPILQNWIDSKQCFYCGKNIAVAGKEANISMYKITGRGIMSTKYSKISIPINRCGFCKKHHDIVSNSYLISFLLLFISSVIIFWAYIGFYGIFISIPISLILANIFGFLFKTIYSVFSKSPSEDDVLEQTHIRKLLYEGWKLGEEPGKYER